MHEVYLFTQTALFVSIRVERSADQEDKINESTTQFRWIEARKKESQRKGRINEWNLGFRAEHDIKKWGGIKKIKIKMEKEKNEKKKKWNTKEYL